ncbi:hypothetical protein IGI04_034978 [Brassica rapa subsp. trilocularis]|uniref:F-box associated domain-containing protein n=1 Tax=Brassica rapa subsp. trilocularis TaxID=1813537 RepID=A0ABQ7LAB4_BRACM|nr:hypothetical protein IGI04_034978 [Brassica rapa subsp. trilocularis]
MVYTFFSVDPWILAARPNEYHGALRSGAIVKGGGFEVGRCTNMYKITDSPFVFQIPKFLDVRSPIFHIVHIQMVNLFYANILLATCETHSLTHTRSSTKFYLDTNILAIEAFTNSYFFSIDTVKTQKANFLFKAWKCATTEWWAVRFLHRLQQEVGQIMECTIPQQMCITQDRRGFKVNGNGGYELLSCLADLDGQQYLFQIRITPYNFTPRHRTFTVSAISDDICS